MAECAEGVVPPGEERPVGGHGRHVAGAAAHARHRRTRVRQSARHRQRDPHLITSGFQNSI
eukprot:2511572-Pyramimonas_sp.AAC.1